MENKNTLCVVHNTDIVMSMCLRKLKVCVNMVKFCIYFRQGIP